MKNDIKINLAVIIKDITPDYMLEQYCKYYSKYDNIVKLHSIIKSDKGEDVDRIVNTLKKYFKHIETDIRLSIYDKYTIEEETIWATDVFNYRMNEGEWFMMADIDEYIELEKIPIENFQQYNLIKGVLIDRIVDRNQVFDENKPIWENYPVKCFLYNVINTSYPIKLMLIKKTPFFIKINCGHHTMLVNAKDAIDYFKFKNIYFPVYHYKWNFNFLKFLDEVINNTKDTRSQMVYLDEQRDIKKFFNDNNNDPYDVLREQIVEDDQTAVEIEFNGREFCKIKKLRMVYV
jgi:hypothetical protein